MESWMASAPAIFNWMSSLSDPTRVRALRLLERHELSVAELCDVLQLPQSTVSRHLKVLSDGGWVDARREGTSNLYTVASDRPAPARKLWTLLREQLGEKGHSASDDQRLQRVLAARQTRSQAFFPSSAGQWDKLREELFGDRLDAPILAGLLDERWSVGDLGCGTGRLLEALSHFVARVIGVDDSPAMLSAARRRTAPLPNVELRRGSMESLPLGDGSLDAALLVLVLHHLAEPPRALAELTRVLKPGGRALVLDMQPHDRAEYRAQMGHAWLGFAPSQLERWLADAGLQAPRVRSIPPEPNVKGPPLFAASAIKGPGSRPGSSAEIPTKVESCLSTKGRDR
ncbi:MAG: metalloregulator ArsR/SmtB family transcription factor [Deltaproteobacteria bacterium]|nr:metalloregulator ArsR/SmtB family transcription factor [Deltaproteobacteria bacterium]